MRAGALNRRVTLQNRGEGYDEAGQPIEGWEDVATVWGDVRFLSGLETVKSGLQVSIAKASIRIRYRVGLNSGMQAVCDGTVFAINAVLPDISRREYVDLVCEVVS